MGPVREKDLPHARQRLRSVHSTADDLHQCDLDPGPPGARACVADDAVELRGHKHRMTSALLRLHEKRLRRVRPDHPGPVHTDHGLDRDPSWLRGGRWKGHPE